MQSGYIVTFHALRVYGALDLAGMRAWCRRHADEVSA